MRRASLAIVVVAILTTTMGGCVVSDEGSEFASLPSDHAYRGYELPDSIRYPMQWVETSAVDLMSPEGTFLRAFYEAKAVAMLGPGGLDETYPGFKEADRASAPNRYPGSQWGELTASHTWSVLDLADLPDGALRAVVCSVVEDRHGDPGAPYIEHLYFRREGTSPLPNQQGPRAAPATNPFGGWYAFDTVNVLSHKTRPGVEIPDVSQCDSLELDKSGQSWPGWPMAGM